MSSILSICSKKTHFPLILLLILLIPLFFGSYIPIEIKSLFYSISLLIKSILLLILPFLIFSFLFSSLLNLGSGVVKFVIMLVSMVFISNYTAICTGFIIGSFALPKFQIGAYPSVDMTLILKPIWEITIPKIISNESALLLGLICGMFFSIKRYSIAETIAKELNRISNLFLKSFFIPLLPFFILGFVFKLEHEQLLARALKTYGPVFFVVIGTQVLYITFLFLISANFSFKTMSHYIKNIIPAIITGFSTSSSAATMPVLINSTEKNLKDPSMAKTILPATINIHTLGSALGLTIISLTTLLTFGHNIPVVSDFLRFAFFYAIAKFGVAAVPGGVIIVVIPLLESYLGFTNEMVGLITAIYMLFDPFGTASNVAGNGVFAIIFSKIHKLSSTKKQKPEVNILPKTR